jgi:hypothetical protein
LPHTREIQATVFSHPYDWQTWDNLVEAAETEVGAARLAAEGTAIDRKMLKDIAELLGVATRRMKIGGVEVPVVNLPYTMASEAAGKLAEDASFAAAYFDREDARVFSLRSRGDNGADVSAIAKMYGGGGHKNAAGFQVPIGWEGSPKIVTTHVYPPIPVRSCDWAAHYDGYEEGGPYGSGPTEADAIRDLIENHDAPT